MKESVDGRYTLWGAMPRVKWLPRFKWAWTIPGLGDLSQVYPSKIGLHIARSLRWAQVLRAHAGLPDPDHFPLRWMLFSYLPQYAA